MQHTHTHTHAHPADTHRLVCWQRVSHVIFLLPRPNLLPLSLSLPPSLSLCWTLGIQNKRPANRTNNNKKKNKNKAELETLCKHKTYKIEFICRKHISHTKRSTSQKKQEEAEAEVEEKKIQVQEEEKKREREREKIATTAQNYQVELNWNFILMTTFVRV